MEKMYVLKNVDYVFSGRSILMNMDIPSEHADILMLSLLDADQKGIYTHGFYRMQSYTTQIDRGNINPKPDIKKIKNGTNIIVMDADNGLGSVAGWYAMQEAIKMSGKRGIGVVGVRKSNHFGAAAYYSEMASKENHIGIAMTNASPAIAPTGSKKALLGNNPWSISVPTRLGHPITLDIANSVAARGKIRLKALKGEEIPLGWAMDNKGEPTINAREALEGVILPIGNYKGYGITLMIDILAGVLMGANFGDGVPLLDDDAIRNNGHLFISMNPDAFMDITDFMDRIDTLAQIIRSAPRIDEDVEILLPGEKEWKTKLSQESEKVKVPERVFKFIHSLCDQYDVQLPQYQSVS